MDELLKPVKTTKKVQSNISKFESLNLSDSRQWNQNGTKPKRSIFEIDTTIEEDEPALKPTSSKILTTPAPVKQLNSTSRKKHKRQNSTAFLQRSYLTEEPPKSLPDDAREILRSQPCHEDLKAVLEYLQYGIDGRHDFDVRITSPKSAQIVNVLVAITIPNIWNNLMQKEITTDEAQIKKMILVCLTSVAGLGALIAQVRQYSASKSDQMNKIITLDTITVLAELLQGPKVVLGFLNQCLRLYDKDVQRRLFWQELSNLLAGGRVLGTVAQALAGSDIVDAKTKHVQWLADGTDYSKWLAKNVTVAATRLQSSQKESWKFLRDLFKRGLSLGHRDVFVSGVYNSLLLGERALWTPLHQLLQELPAHDQRVVFDVILYDLNRNQLNESKFTGDTEDVESQRAISAAAALIAGLVKQNEVLEEYLEEWLVIANVSYAAVGLASRRALIAVLARSESKLEAILDRSLTSFADKLRIQHGSILQQEAYAQTILLAIGCLQRIDPKTLKGPSISTLVMRSVSNRLAASVPRARFLGMVVGVAVSRIVDAPDRVLNFGIDEMDGKEAKWWFDLPNLHDKVGDISDLRNASANRTFKQPSTKTIKSTATAKKKVAPAHTSKIIAIEEISDSSTGEEEEDDDDLIPFGKPDSDPEDSDEDPTLINRSKPSAPVYIVDLVRYLDKTDQRDTVELALKTAPSLIKRKASFGTEVTDNIHNLATALINLQEGMSDPDIQQLRLESLIACVVAKPDAIAPSFATLYFEGDFSVSQRVTLLTAIGLGAREVAGFKDQTNTTTSQQEEAETSFPSKRLPPNLDPSSPRILQARTNPITALTTTAAASTIRPMALAAADKMTGPSILKIRTFSSRMEVEKRTKQKSEARTKVIPKNLHVLLTKSFYLPLGCRMSLLLSHVNSSSPNTTILQPDLVKMLLQTLVLLLHTLGPSASLHLPTLTHETLLLLVALYSVPGLSTDPVVLPALLHLLLALIDLTIEAGVTAQERLITEHGNQVAELVNWAGKLGERISVPEVEEDGGMPWSVLAAGIQVKWFEMGQRFQGRMLGLMGNELDGF